jgi:proline iminopeptidase
MRTLYPALEPRRSFRLKVDPPHELHVEECGNPDGIPIVFLHGGPGAGCEPFHRRFFDPARYRIVLFDQRGSGRSTPHAGLEGNTTWALVEDMERIRTMLGIERWAVFGGSWGSTLALAYAEKHPERVLGLVLRGIFLCRADEIRWFYQDGVNRIYPDHWQDYLAPIPPAERGDLLTAYRKQLTSDDAAIRERAAIAWSVWEARCATLKPNPKLLESFGDAHLALALARIENHYFVHDCWFEPDQLIRDAARLKGIPGFIVHGRYDMCCPVENAWLLHRAWPEAAFRIVDDAGHAASEPGITDALVEATDALAARLGTKR